MATKDNLDSDKVGEGEPGNPEPLDPNTLALGKEICDEVEAQLSARVPLEDSWMRWHKLYNETPRTSKKEWPWQGASNIVVGLAAIYCDSIVAKIMQSLFQIDPFWLIEATSKKTMEVAKPLERFLDQARRVVWNEERVIKPAVLELVKLGTCIIYNGWVNQPMWRIDPTTKQRVAAGRLYGPRPQWVPRADFLIPVGFNKINDSEDGPKAPWVAHRQWHSRASLQIMENSGFLQNLEKVYLEPDDLTDDAKQQLGQMHQSDSVGDTEMTEIYSFWNVWFSKDLDEDGYPEEWVMTVHLPTKSVVRIQPNPYVDSFRPFVSCPFIEQEGNFDGIGVPQMVEQYQEEVSTIHNQRRDNAHLANTTMLKARKGSGIKERDKFYPGKIWFLNDPNDVQELQMGQNYMSTIQEEQVSVGMAERRVGISDLNLGRESSPIGRAAATTVMNLLQEGARKFDLNTSELRRMIGEQGMQVIELYQTHGLPSQMEAGSPELYLDPEEAVIVRTFLSNQDRIRGLIGLRVNASTPAALNKEQVNLQLFEMASNYFQQVVGMLQFFMQVPPPVQEILIKMLKGADVLLDRIFKSQGAFDLDQILMGEAMEQLMQVQAAQQQMQPPQGAPGQLPPPGVQPGAGGPPNAQAPVPPTQ